jgi:Spy/CpxP family protein refolding chaperone
MESHMRGRERGDRGVRLLRLLENDRVKTELGLSDEQSQRLRQIVVDTEKSSIKTRADLAVRGIELRELLRSNNPDRNAVMSKVQEISNLRGEMMKQHVGALLAAKAVLTPEQQKKIQAFIERRQAAAPGQSMRMGPQRRPAPGPPPEPESMPKPPAQ